MSNMTDVKCNIYLYGWIKKNGHIRTNLAQNEI